MSHLDPDVTARAITALTSGQETYTAGQVAYLLALALNVDTGEPHDDQVAVNLAYQAGHAAGFDAGEEAAYAEVHADLRYALGGPEAKTMREAVQIAQADLLRREHIRFREQNRQPYPLRLDDPTWPPVTVPGTVTDPKAIRGVWPCHCPRTRDGSHVNPPDGDPNYWAQPRKPRRHLQAVA
ncbi:hypothetical protein ACIA5A_05900 [Micromonospora sp. NPDC051300]|uniref:hypothetical protein n=1 Tax=Micromonospora sp. NPDC051300 TaxID=3364286 RepID=UPI0037897071